MEKFTILVVCKEFIQKCTVTRNCIITIYKVYNRQMGAEVLHYFSENLLKVLEGRFESQELYVSCLNFLSVVCCEESKLQQRHTEESTTVSITVLLNTSLQQGTY